MELSNVQGAGDESALRSVLAVLKFGQRRQL